MSNLIVCRITGKEYTSLRGFLNHLRTLKLSSKEYYDTYLKCDGEGICYCGNKTTFSKFKYNKYCSDICACKSEEKREIIRKKFLGERGKEKLKSFSKKKKRYRP